MDIVPNLVIKQLTVQFAYRTDETVFPWPIPCELSVWFIPRKQSPQ